MSPARKISMRDSNFKNYQIKSLEQAVEEAKERRTQFENSNSQYIETKLKRIIEPLIINLLNEQPDDVLLGMENWLTT